VILDSLIGPPDTIVMKIKALGYLSACLLTMASGPVRAQEGGAAPVDAAAELAKKLQNPVASLISVPFKWSWDEGIGPADAERNTFIVQPVIPVSLNEDWNLIIRTIIPYVDAQSPVPGGSNLSGLGDIVQSFFFSPKALTANGWVWAVGPVLGYPSASENALGSENWSAGPTFLVLKQQNGWTFGALGNHLWSFSGPDDRTYTSATFLQPFLSFTTKKRTTLGLNTESTYDWNGRQWTVPINATVSQLLRFGKRPVSIAFTARAYADRPPGGPDWGLSATFTLLFPK
jgi:hypothetical protein